MENWAEHDKDASYYNKDRLHKSVLGHEFYLIALLFRLVKLCRTTYRSKRCAEAVPTWLSLRCWLAQTAFAEDKQYLVAHIQRALGRCHENDLEQGPLATNRVFLFFLSLSYHVTLHAYYYYIYHEISCEADTVSRTRYHAYLSREVAARGKLRNRARESEHSDVFLPPLLFFLVPGVSCLQCIARARRNNADTVRRNKAISRGRRGRKDVRLARYVRNPRCLSGTRRWRYSVLR